MTVDLSIIIPTYARSRLLPLVVEAWQQRIPSGIEAEIVIVDDGSPDDTGPVLRELEASWDGGPGRVRALSQKNRGRSAARNRGIDEAQGRLLLFSDDDMVPQADEFVACHLDVQDREPGAWVSRLVIPESVVTTPFQAYWQRRLQGGNRSIPSGKDLGKGGFWFATLSIPKDLLGGNRFSEQFREYGWEEHEMGYRLHRQGIRPRFLREAVIEHHDAVEFEGTRRKYRQMGRSAWVFLGLHPSLEVSVWTGTHPLSRAFRRLIRLESRSAHLLGRSQTELTDRDYNLCLEASYAAGLRDGQREVRRKSETAKPGLGLAKEGNR